MITTERLTLRHFTAADAPAVQRLAGAREVAAGTLLIPHPYHEGAAEEWIASQAERQAQGSDVLAIEADGEVVGAIGMRVEHDHDRGELGYWIGVPFWGRGYATEAARAVVEYAFSEQGLNRVFAVHFTNNPASGRVLQKIGMQHEGTMRRHVKKWGEYLDVEMYGMVK
jgi:RimJ/RimL family protein N-acetyltransferase